MTKDIPSDYDINSQDQNTIEYQKKNYPESWETKLYCMNEDLLIEITIPFGTTAIEYLDKEKPMCESCGNYSLRAGNSPDNRPPDNYIIQIEEDLIDSQLKKTSEHTENLEKMLQLEKKKNGGTNKTVLDHWEIDCFCEEEYQIQEKIKVPYGISLHDFFVKNKDQLVCPSCGNNDLLPIYDKNRPPPKQPKKITDMVI